MHRNEMESFLFPFWWDYRQLEPTIGGYIDSQCWVRVRVARSGHAPLPPRRTMQIRSVNEYFLSSHTSTEQLCRLCPPWLSVYPPCVPGIQSKWKYTQAEPCLACPLNKLQKHRQARLLCRRESGESSCLVRRALLSPLWLRSNWSQGHKCMFLLMTEMKPQ